MMIMMENWPWKSPCMTVTPSKTAQISHSALCTFVQIQIFRLFHPNNMSKLQVSLAGVVLWRIYYRPVGPRRPWTLQGCRLRCRSQPKLSWLSPNQPDVNICTFETPILNSTAGFQVNDKAILLQLFTCYNRAKKKNSSISISVQRMHTISNLSSSADNYTKMAGSSPSTKRLS